METVVNPEAFAQVDGNLRIELSHRSWVARRLSVRMVVSHRDLGRLEWA